MHRNRRSLNANAMLWVIIGKMAEILRTDKDQVYLTMLERYGQFTPIVCKPEAVAKLKQEWRTVKEIGGGAIGNQDAVQLLCYYGSHTYNSKEFSILLDGVVSEAKEIGIDVLSEHEKSLLIDNWRKENG